jgi:hypothetical protein
VQELPRALPSREADWAAARVLLSEVPGRILQSAAPTQGPARMVAGQEGAIVMSTYYIEMRSQSSKSHRIRVIHVKAKNFIWGISSVSFHVDDCGAARTVLEIAREMVVSVSENRKLRS